MLVTPLYHVELSLAVKGGDVPSLAYWDPHCLLLLYELLRSLVPLDRLDSFRATEGQVVPRLVYWPPGHLGVLYKFVTAVSLTDSCVYAEVVWPSLDLLLTAQLQIQKRIKNATFSSSTLSLTSDASGANSGGLSMGRPS